jgi:predicted protein tyrosine phosphatase
MHKPSEDQLAPGDAEWRERLKAVLIQKQENDQQIADLLRALRGELEPRKELCGVAQRAARELRARGPPVEQRSEERRAYRIPDFCWKYGISRSTTYALAKAGRLRLTKVNRRTLVLHEDAEALLRAGVRGGLPEKLE